MGGGGTWVNFCSASACAAGLSEPLTRYSQFCGQLLTPSSSLLTKCIFGDPMLVTFCLSCICLIIFIVLIPSYKNMFTPKIPKISDPILLTLEKSKAQ